MPGSSQDILAQNNINRFQLIHLFRDIIVNVDVNDIFFSINNIFPKNISNLSKRDNVDVTTPPRWQWCWWWWLSWWWKKTIYVDIGFVEFMQFMKYLLVSLFHSGNLTFQLSFRANQALPKRKVLEIIQSSLSNDHHTTYIMMWSAFGENEQALLFLFLRSGEQEVPCTIGGRMMEMMIVIMW